jgi:hypothetical protein
MPDESACYGWFMKAVIRQIGAEAGNQALRPKLGCVGPANQLR